MLIHTNKLQAQKRACVPENTVATESHFSMVLAVDQWPFSCSHPHFLKTFFPLRSPVFVSLGALTSCFILPDGRG